MPRKQVLVQLDDDLVRRLDEVAADLDVSRSELLRRGAVAVLEAHRMAEQDRALMEAYRLHPQDPAIVASARRFAAETGPQW